MSGKARLRSAARRSLTSKLSSWLELFSTGISCGKGGVRARVANVESAGLADGDQHFRHKLSVLPMFEKPSIEQSLPKFDREETVALEGETVKARRCTLSNASTSIEEYLHGLAMMRSSRKTSGE